MQLSVKHKKTKCGMPVVSIIIFLNNYYILYKFYSQCYFSLSPFIMSIYLFKKICIFVATVIFVLRTFEKCSQSHFLIFLLSGLPLFNFFFWTIICDLHSRMGFCTFFIRFLLLLLFNCMIYTLFQSQIYYCIYYSCLLVLLLNSYLLYLG